MLARKFVGRFGAWLRIDRQCAVVPSKDRNMYVLGAGTVVRVWNGGESPQRIPHELPVEYRDLGPWNNKSIEGEVKHGWISGHTPVSVPRKTPKKLPEMVAMDAREGLTHLDLLRSHVPWMSLRTWLENYGTNNPKELRRVVRELGGIAKKSDDPQTTITRLIRMMELPEDTRMAKDKKVEETEQETPAKGKKSKKGKKAATKSTEKSESAGRSNSMRVSCGNALVPLLPKGSARALAKRLQADEALSSKQLIELRDGVNEAAASAREAGDGKLASKLSAGNRIVRRLQRAAK